MVRPGAKAPDSAETAGRRFESPRARWFPATGAVAPRQHAARSTARIVRKRHGPMVAPLGAKMRRQRLISDVTAALAVAGLAVLAGCSTTEPVGRAPVRAAVGNQGGSWEVVLGTPEAPPFNEWEYARLDDAMNLRTHIEEGPALDDLRRLYLNPRPDQILYFRRDGRRW